MTMLIPLSIFGFVVLTALGAYWMFSKPQNVGGDRLKKMRADDGDPMEIELESPMMKMAEKVAEPINRILPPSPEQMGKLQKQLVYAGFRSPNAPMIYRAIQLLSLVAFPVLAWIAFMIWTGGKGSLMFWLIIGVMLGYLPPRIALDQLVTGRQRRLRWGLTDALDLMVVSVEAGLGINQAMVRISNELRAAHPDICEEFEMVNTEIRVGREREEALRNLAGRTGVEDLHGLCAMLIQADRFGTSIARAIRVYSDSLRTKRRQRAEQAAQKAAVKLLIPLALFLFPTLFIALLGPAAIQLYDQFAK
jgi:tight adherence protein C